MIKGPFVLVQNNHVTANTALLARAARGLGLNVLDVSFPWTERPRRPSDRCVFAYGSVAFAKALRGTEWAPDVFWSDEAFRANYWAARYGNAYLGAGGHAVATENVDRLLPAAIRPLLGDKAFRGGVYETWTAGDKGMAWLSPIQDIEREVRVWIVGGQPVCAGQYRPYVAPIALAEVATHLPEPPLPNIVVDLALVHGAWKIVEFNCINTSGFYAIDPASILTARLTP